MLPRILKKTNQWMYRSPEEEDWLEYLEQIGDHAQSIDPIFLSEICYDHWDRFNTYFPDFDLNVHKIARRTLSALEVNELIRYDMNQKVNFWSLQFDQFFEKVAPTDYFVFQHMVEHKTWSFPPVIIDNSQGFASTISKLDKDRFGMPYHLIEGTHRVSYLNRMLERGLINPDSEHEVIWLSQM